MIIVGFTGRAGSGKDTLADHLCLEHDFRKSSFALTLKTMLAVAGMPEPFSREDKERPLPGFTFTWREAAQKLGTEWGRALDPDIWVKMQMNLLLDMPGDTRVVFSDVRFNNEADMIRQIGGKIVHITGRAADLGANAGHASESGVHWEDGDVALDNSALLSATIAQLELVLKEML